MLLTVGLKQFAVVKEGLVGELLLVLLPDPVMGFVVPSPVLQKHYLQVLPGFCVGEFAIVEKGCDPCAKYMYTFFGNYLTLEKSSPQKCQSVSLLLQS